MPPSLSIVTTEQLEAVAAEYRQQQSVKPTTPTGTGIRLNAKSVSTGRGASVLDRARAYLAKMSPAISGQGGHSATLNAACRLVKGFSLSADDAFTLLCEWNTRCEPPWTEAELRHKIESAQKSNEPDGSLLNEPRPASRNRVGDGPDVLDVDDPRRLALLFLERFCTRDGEYRFIRWNEEWLKWDSTNYQILKAEGMKSLVTNFIQQELEADAAERLANYAKLPPDKQGKPPKSIKVTGHLRNNVIDHIGALTYTPPTVLLPSWIRNQPSGFDSKEIVLAKNGIVNLRKLMSGDPDYLIPSTPDYFATGCLPFDFVESAPDPVEWLRFLDTLWPGDPESIQCLQEWMGLLLVPNLDYQKMLMVVGPPRSGKGTIIKVIQDLVGPANIAAPDLAGLATNFGCSPLLGKQVAIIGDSRISPKTDTAVVTEKLLRISSGDPITIDRKNREAVTLTVPSRVVLMTNEIPRLIDASNALSSRFVILQMTRSFLGCEDLKLYDRIKTELQSILIWAISGWQRLIQNGRFTIPETSREITQQMADSSSPVGAFVREKCEVDPTFTVDRKILFTAWVDWCNAENRAHPGNTVHFGIQLRSVIPNLKRSEPIVMGFKQNLYIGLKLKEFATSVDDLPTPADRPLF